MFKKIVSNLPFSPTLISELGFYAKRLKKEEATRRTGLILTALALAVQSLVVFSPPESANAANPSDIISGGVYTKSALLAAWDNNTQGFRDIMQYASITRQNLVDSKDGNTVEIHSRNNGADAGWRSWGRVARYGASRGEAAHNINGTTIYTRPLSNHDTGNNINGTGSWYKVFMGTNSLGQQFAIIKSCANLTMKEDPKPRTMTVCRLADKKYPVTINESEFNQSLHSKNPDDCKEQPKDITVCRLADKKYPVTIKENEFDSTKYSKNPDDCKEVPVPSAQCSSLSHKMISRTKAELQASASTVNGATISAYTFIVTDKSGKEVLRKTIKSTSGTASIQHDLVNDGVFRAKVIVSTSVGDKDSSACETELTVKPIERCPLNPALPINDPDCQPCPGDPTLWVKDDDCAAKIVRNKKATNLTSNKPATDAPAKASERIEFKLQAKNEGKDVAEFEMKDDISDILEYASLYDRGGATLNEQTKVLSWGKITLKPGEQRTSTYVVQMASQISPMARGASDPTSYDCRMINVFGNTVEVEVDCPAPKVVEQIVPELPRTGPAENTIFGGVVAAVAAFLYFRSRQLNKEVRLVRREVTAGTI